MDSSDQGTSHSALAWVLAQVSQTVAVIPGSPIVLRYIKNSYQNDPFRVVLEVFLLLFVVWYLLEKRYRIDHHEIQLTKQEVDELVDDWQPEPLVPELSAWEKQELEQAPLLSSGQSSEPVVKVRADGSERKVLNLATYNFLGLVDNDEFKDKAIHTLRKYGVGSCGPPGFYGTLDVHMDLEEKIAKFLNVQSAIIYSQGLTTTLSVIPCFSKRGDLIICDEAVNFGVQKGIQITRSQVRYFKHNDMADLERILKEVQAEDLATKRTVTRRFIVAEGLYINCGDLVPLPELVRLKEQYKYRLILDESYSFGVMGKHGRGITEHFGVPTEKVDLLIGSMCNALCSSGGFCAGRIELIEHQRLSGLGYVFSASLPAILAVYAIDGLDVLSSGRGPQILTRLRANAKVIANGLRPLTQLDAIQLLGGGEGGCNTKSNLSHTDEDMPVFHLKLDRAWARAHLPLSDTLAVIPSDPRKPLLTEARVAMDQVLQRIVDLALDQGLLLTRAKYIASQERVAPDPSIRICVSAAHTEQATGEATQIIRQAVHQVLENL
ncbi:serine palmitoyltransferase component [Dimargaris xerosporica]|nr:serine palmitoyltransferase component [Dimargaris xerosporica]